MFSRSNFKKEDALASLSTSLQKSNCFLFTLKTAPGHLLPAPQINDGKQALIAPKQMKQDQDLSLKSFSKVPQRQMTNGIHKYMPNFPTISNGPMERQSQMSLLQSLKRGPAIQMSATQLPPKLPGSLAMKKGLQANLGHIPQIPKEQSKKDTSAVAPQKPMWKKQNSKRAAPKGLQQAIAAKKKASRTSNISMNSFSQLGNQVGRMMGYNNGPQNQYQQGYNNNNWNQNQNFNNNQQNNWNNNQPYQNYGNNQQNWNNNYQQYPQNNNYNQNNGFNNYYNDYGKSQQSAYKNIEGGFQKINQYVPTDSYAAYRDRLNNGYHLDKNENNRGVPNISYSNGYGGYNSYNQYGQNNYNRPYSAPPMQNNYQNPQNSFNRSNSYPGQGFNQQPQSQFGQNNANWQQTPPQQPYNNQGNFGQQQWNQNGQQQYPQQNQQYGQNSYNQGQSYGQQQNYGGNNYYRR